MPRKTYIWKANEDGQGGSFVDITKLREMPPEARAPFVIDDSMPPTEHLVTGEVIDSKSRFRAITKAHGCFEVGNDLMSKRPEKAYEPMPREDVREAIHRSLDLHGHRKY